MTCLFRLQHLFLALCCAASSFAAPGEEKVTGSPLEGQSNFRDLGGYETSDGYVVRTGVLFRSGELHDLTEADIEHLRQLEIGTVINFLTNAEIEAHGEDRLPDGVDSKHLPIDTADKLAESLIEARRTADFSKVPVDMNPRIHRLLVHEGAASYARLVRTIITSDEPVLFHCSHGVHRTGTAAAIILSAVGVPWEIVRKDYLLSNKYRKEEVERRLGELRAHAARNRGIAPDDVDMKNFEAFYVLEGEYIDASLDEIRKRHGSLRAYLKKGLGLSDKELAALRRVLLKKQPRGATP